MTLGKKIKLRRELLGLGQVELAERTGIAQSYISRLENDKFQPTAPVICSLAKGLKCSTDYLIGDSDERRKAG